jgi:hypothetical protein
MPKKGGVSYSSLARPKVQSSLQRVDKTNLRGLGGIKDIECKRGQLDHENHLWSSMIKLVVSKVTLSLALDVTG